MGWRKKPRDIQRRAGGGLVLNDRVYVNCTVCGVKSVQIVTIAKSFKQPHAPFYIKPFSVKYDLCCLSIMIST